MCTTIGFPYKNGFVFGRTLEIGMTLDNMMLYVPADQKEFIPSKDRKFDTKYAVLGSAFFNIPSFGDGINEKGLMGSSNFFPKYASFSKKAVQGKISLITSDAFDYLLTRCKDAAEVRAEAENIIIVQKLENVEGPSMANHFFFMDAKGDQVVLEPKDGVLIAYDNPYGVLTNSPDFDWHATNLKNYINLKPENIDEGSFNETVLSKFGEGTGMLGLPGDFTPTARFVRAAYFVSNTDKSLARQAAILQGLRILSQFDIPAGAIIDPIEKHRDETLYTAIMDTAESAYYIKCHDNINIQKFCLKDLAGGNEIKFFSLEKTMDL